MSIAAPLAAAPVADDLAGHLGRMGHIIVSGWHSACVATRPLGDPTLEDARVRILSDNIADIDKAEGVIVLAAIGVPKATVGDVVWAIAKGKPVGVGLSATGMGRCLWDSHEHGAARSTSRCRLSFH